MTDTATPTSAWGHLFPQAHPTLCDEPRFHDCPKAVALHHGRWWITFGHPGFNSHANNSTGYTTEAIARGAIRRYSRPGRR